MVVEQPEFTRVEEPTLLCNQVAWSIPLVPQGAYQARALQTIIETLGAWGHFAVYNLAPMRGVADI
jgi:hypothetical protein